MSKFKLEIQYDIASFNVYLRSEIAGKKTRELVVSVSSNHPSLDLDDLLLFVIKKLKWIFRERDDRFIEAGKTAKEVLD